MKKFVFAALLTGASAFASTLPDLIITQQSGGAEGASRDKIPVIRGP